MGSGGELNRLFFRVIPNQLANGTNYALIPNPSPEGEGSRIQSPSPLGRGLKACGIKEKGEGVICSIC